MNTNWAKILLFSLLSFALGVILCLLLCGRCGGECGMKGGCGKGASCTQAGMGHGNCHGGNGACMGKAACCSKSMGLDMPGRAGDEQSQRIVKELEAADFQGDTTIAIQGGAVNVKRTGDRTEVRVEIMETDTINEQN